MLLGMPFDNFTAIESFPMFRLLDVPLILYLYWLDTLQQFLSVTTAGLATLRETGLP